MLKSMTGYGRKTIKHRQDTMVTVEIKTINSRYLDILSKIPRKLQSLELELTNCSQKALQICVGALIIPLYPVPTAFIFTVLWHYSHHKMAPLLSSPIKEITPIFV